MADQILRYRLTYVGGTAEEIECVKEAIEIPDYEPFVAVERGRDGTRITGAPEPICMRFDLVGGDVLTVRYAALLNVRFFARSQ